MPKQDYLVSSHQLMDAFKIKGLAFKDKGLEDDKALVTV